MNGENALFNEKTIKRLCSKTKITAKQKKAAKTWLEKLEADSLRSERENYLDFNNILLRDLLGYDGGDIKFEVDNVEFSANDSTGKRGICFEVKGTKTKDLFAKQARGNKAHETPVKQLWDYMSKDATTFGIITNYRTFILFDYSKGRSKYHQFDFSKIKNNDDKLKEFVSIFSKDSILEKKFVEELYKQSVKEEKEFTKEFYKLFHETRLMLIEEFKANEELADELRTPLHFAQLYLNRLMFILFAEDTGKLPPRVFEERILKILKSDGLISEHSRYVSDTLRDLFVSVDKGATTPDKIFGFNGGLFEAPIPHKIYFKDLRDKKFFKEVYQHSQLKKEIKLDEDSQKILNTQGDKLNPLIKNLILMASFDFNTEVNVNILGHIFEQSITDIESLQKGDISRRKKEGVYYTPEYITDYICRNTIIPYLSKKDAKTSRNLVLEYRDNIEELENKFKNIKIVDTACGSGAFLIKAVDILLEIHKEIQLFKQDRGAYTAIKKGLKVKKDEGQLILGKWVEEDEARKIIENNIFGVDINEESIEITKLSLFLKIAKKNKKLIDLSQNIKCGNSLIDVEEIAEEKAFEWENNFKDIFEKGGFDVILGNPPYIRSKNLSEKDRKYISENYKISGTFDIYVIFIEKCMSLLKKGGRLGFINPNKYFYSDYGREIRGILSSKYKIEKIFDFNEFQVFKGITTYTAINIFKKSDVIGKFEYYKVNNKKLPNSTIFSVLLEGAEHSDISKINVSQKSLDKNSWNFKSDKAVAILNKIETDNPRLIDLCYKIYQGFVLTPTEVFPVSIENETKDTYLIKPIKKDDNVYEIEKDLIVQIIKSSYIKKYNYVKGNYFAIFPYKYISDDKVELVPLDKMKSKFPKTLRYLESKSDYLKTREDNKWEKSEKWYEYSRHQNFECQKMRKILAPGLATHARYCIGEENIFIDQGSYGIILKQGTDLHEKYILALLNSRILDYFLKSSSGTLSGNYYPYQTKYLSKLSICKISPSEQTPFIKKSDIMIKLSEEFYSKKSKFKRVIKTNFSVKEISKKLEYFYYLTFENFINEIVRISNHEISLEQQTELLDFFDKYKKELLEIEKRMEETNRSIDKMTYNLYDLTDEEIKIVEGTY